MPNKRPCQTHKIHRKSPPASPQVILFNDSEKTKDRPPDYQARLEMLFNMLPVGISILNADRQIIFENETLGRILDISQERLIKGDFLQRKYIHPDGSPMSPDEFASARAFQEGRAVENFEIGIITEKGITTWCNVSANPMPFEDWRMLVTTMDITDLKRAEEQMLILSKFPTENPHPVMRLEQDGRILYANKASAPLLETWKTGVGQYIPAALIPTLAEAFESGQTRDVEVACPDQVFSCIISPIKNAGYLNIYAHDITDRRHMQEVLREQSQNLEKLVQDRTSELAEANQRLVQVLEDEKNIRMQLVQTEKHSAIGRMMASIAHELNNPIQTIQNCLYITQQEIPAESVAREFVDMASGEIERIARLVSQLREIYKPQLSEEVRSIDLIKTLREIHTLLMPHLHHEEVVLEICSPPEPVFITGISNQIKQVFINLALNAIEAMQPGGGRLSFEISLPANSKMATVSVRDTGPGIKPQDLPRLFEPFFTTKETGMGMGLSICYDIVKNMGGDINVKSPPGQGSTFEVWLPLAAQAPAGQTN